MSDTAPPPDPVESEIDANDDLTSKLADMDDLDVAAEFDEDDAERMAFGPEMRHLSRSDLPDPAEVAPYDADDADQAAALAELGLYVQPGSSRRGAST